MWLCHLISPQSSGDPRAHPPRAWLTWSLMGATSWDPHKPDSFCYKACGFSRCPISANWEPGVCACVGVGLQPGCPSQNLEASWEGPLPRPAGPWWD